MADLTSDEIERLKLALGKNNVDGTIVDRVKNVLNKTDGDFPAGVTFTIGAEAANVINVAMQFTDHDGDDMAVPCQALVYTSSDSAGQTLRDPPATDTVVGTDGTILVTHGTRNVKLCVSEADGDLDLNITDASGAQTYYLNVCFGGRVFTSDVITFAA